MLFFTRDPRRATKGRAVVGLSVVVLVLAACSAPGSSEPMEADLTVEAEDARRALEGVKVSEGNVLRLYPATSSSPSAAPTRAVSRDMFDESSGAIRNRTLSEMGDRANVDPEICNRVRDVGVSYLAAPEPNSNSYKAVSEDSMTAVTVALKDSAQRARDEVTDSVDLYARCRDMTLNVAGMTLETHVIPLDIPVDADTRSSAMIRGSVVGAPLKTMMVQGAAGNAVVTVAYFDSDALVAGQEGRSPAPDEDLERQAADVANAVLRNLRDQAA